MTLHMLYIFTCFACVQQLLASSQDADLIFLRFFTGRYFSPCIPFKIASNLTNIIHNLLAAFDVGDITSVFKDGGWKNDKSVFNPISAK